MSNIANKKKEIYLPKRGFKVYRCGLSGKISA
jgi:hypothetical protein